MKIGTKSVLYGAHCFFIHPWFVALAWWRLYGFPWDFRLWVAFFLHDLGYWGKPNMDGPEGEKHPIWGALVMHHLFDSQHEFARICNRLWGEYPASYWCNFVRYHSRYLAKQDGTMYSRLCPADKLAVALEPWWLYLPRVRLTGEVWEYMHEQSRQRSLHWEPERENPREWHTKMVVWCREWAYTHRDMRSDSWTLT